MKHITVKGSECDLLTLEIDGVAVSFPPETWMNLVAGTYGKLSLREVLEVRKLCGDPKWPSRRIAARFGISQRQVFRISSGESFSWLDPVAPNGEEA